VTPGSSTFTEAELRYLSERRLGRLATVGKDGTPHVAPVGWSYRQEHDAIEVGGRDFARSKKYRDVARFGRAAIVIDDLASVDPWRPRGVEVRGPAEVVDDPPRIRIHPQRVVSWGLESDDFFERDARTVG
jgi:pyridoxamine 5'-phosphate oxidase family protein